MDPIFAQTLLYFRECGCSSRCPEQHGKTPLLEIFHECREKAMFTVLQGRSPCISWTLLYMESICGDVRQQFWNNKLINNLNVKGVPFYFSFSKIPSNNIIIKEQLISIYTFHSILYFCRMIILWWINDLSPVLSMAPILYKIGE